MVAALVRRLSGGQRPSVAHQPQPPSQQPHGMTPPSRLLRDTFPGSETKRRSYKTEVPGFFMLQPQDSESLVLIHLQIIRLLFFHYHHRRMRNVPQSAPLFLCPSSAPLGHLLTFSPARDRGRDAVVSENCRSTDSTEGCERGWVVRAPWSHPGSCCVQLYPGEQTVVPVTHELAG